MPDQKTYKNLSSYLFDFAFHHKWKFLGLFSTSIIWSLTTALFPYLIKVIVDQIVSFKGDPKLIYSVVATPIIIYIGLRIALSFFMRVEDILRINTLPRVKAELQSDLFSRVNRHSYAFFQENMSGSMSNKILNLGDSFERIYTAIHQGLFPCIVSFLISTAIMWQCVPAFAYFFIGWFILALTVTSYLATKSISLSNDRAAAESAVSGNIVDVFRNIVTVLTFYQANRELVYLDHLQEQEIKAAKILEWELIKIHIFRSLSTTVMLIFMLFLLIEGWRNGWVTIGDFTFISGTAFSTAHLVWHASKEFVSLYKEWGIAYQSYLLTQVPYQNLDLPHAPLLQIPAGLIRFDQVTFNYDQNNELFEKQSIIIQPNQKVGLVGYSGSGKTTFVKLIMRFYNPQEGTVSIDEQDLRLVTKASILNQVAMIPQNPGLFNRSVLDNISYGKPDATLAEVTAAARLAHCDEFISELDDQYHTIIGEQGERLSAGQRQRLAIARAAIKPAKILILDEATAALDSATEQKIQESINQLMQNKTTLIIAHRLATLISLDRILVFHKGKIIEDGTHTELISKNGHYANLWKLQTNGLIL